MLNKIKNMALKTDGIKLTLIKNTSWLSLAELITRLSKFVLIIYATRVLGPNGFGQFSFALAFVALFAIISDLGLSQLITREISQQKEKEKDFSIVLSLKIALTLLMLLVIVTYSKLTVSDPVIIKSILILSIYMFATSIGDFYYAFFQAKQKMEFEARAKIVQAIVTTISGLLLITFLRSSSALSLSYVLGGILALLYIVILYKKKTNPRPLKINAGVWKNYLKIAWPLALSGIFVTIYSNIDSVMMGYWGQITQVGWYNAAYRITAIALIPASLLFRIFYPAVAESYTHSKDKFKKIWVYYLKISLLMIFPVLFFGIGFAPQIINIVYGSQYHEAALSLRILVGMVSIVIISYPFNQVLIAAGKQKKIFWATFGGAAGNMILNFILIPKYSLNGAATATVLAVLIVFILQAYYSKEHIYER